MQVVWHFLCGSEAVADGKMTTFLKLTGSFNHSKSLGSGVPSGSSLGDAKN